MISIEFTRNRVQCTRDTQANLAVPPTSWVWAEKGLGAWDNDLGTIDQLITEESTRRTQWRTASDQWNTTLDRLQELTRETARAGAYHFRNDPVKLNLFENLATDARDRAGKYAQGLAARDAWQEADPSWTLSPTDTIETLSDLLIECLARQSADSQKFTAWRRVSATLMSKARQLDEDVIAWYAAANRRFPAGSTEGELIRSTVPTTTGATNGGSRSGAGVGTEAEVGQAVIDGIWVNGDKVAVEASAPGAKRYTFLQQAPGSAAFVVAVAEAEDGYLELANQPPGLHRFKVIGSNANGSGPESTITEATVGAAAAGQAAA